MLFGAEADHASYLLPVLEHEESRNRRNPQSRSEIEFLVGVELDNLDLSPHLVGQFFEDRCSSLAGAAAGAVCIHQDRHGRFQNLGPEIAAVDFDDVHGWSSILTFSLISFLIVSMI